MVYMNNFIHKHFWKKYNYKLLLDFKEIEIEKSYQIYLYNKLFFVISLLVFLSNFINSFVYFYYSLSVQVNFLDQNASSFPNNSTTIIKQNYTANVTYRIETDLIDDSVTILGVICSATSLAIFTLVFAHKYEAFNYRKFASFLMNMGLRLLFFSMSVWFSQIYQNDFGNHFIFMNIQSFFIHTYSLFIDPTYYLCLIVQVLNFLIITHYNPSMSSLQTSMGGFFHLVFYIVFFYIYDIKLKDSYYYNYL